MFETKFLSAIQLYATEWLNGPTIEALIIEKAEQGSKSENNYCIDAFWIQQITERWIQAILSVVYNIHALCEFDSNMAFIFRYDSHWMFRQFAIIIIIIVNHVHPVTPSSIVCAPIEYLLICDSQLFDANSAIKAE